MHIFIIIIIIIVAIPDLKANGRGQIEIAKLYDMYIHPKNDSYIPLYALRINRRVANIQLNLHQGVFLGVRLPYRH